MSAENKKDTVWKLEDQKWWQEYRAMIQREKMKNGNTAPENIYYGSGFGSGSNTSGLFVHGSNTSGLYIHGSNTSAYGSGLYIHGSNTSGLYIHGSNTSAYGSGLYIHSSNAAVYGAQEIPVQEETCTVDMTQVFVPDYLREAAKNSSDSANNAAGVLAYGLDLI